MAALFAVPYAIPGVGIDYQYFFIMVMVLMAWFTIKWNSVSGLQLRSGLVETVLGALGVVGVFGYKLATQTRLGLLDMVIIFGSLVLVFFGLKGFKLFWVPMGYGVILLAGYQLEAVIPNFVALQNWMAGVMADSMRAIGVGTTVSGEYVTLSSAAGPLVLNVESECTGLQGILAFGLLSTMSVLDLKAKPVRLAVVFAVGFLGAFLINIVRLFGVFLAFDFLGAAIGSTVHVYLGYALFVVWVMVFWSIAFKYLYHGPSPGIPAINQAPASPAPGKV